ENGQQSLVACGTRNFKVRILGAWAWDRDHARLDLWVGIKLGGAQAIDRVRSAFVEQQQIARTLNVKPQHEPIARAEHVRRCTRYGSEIACYAGGVQPFMCCLGVSLRPNPVRKTGE